MNDALQQPVEYRYPSDDRPTESPRENLPDDAGTWHNCWDFHPFAHGGRFARWDGSQWEVLEVTPPSAWPEDEHIFEWHGVHPSEVWQDADDPMTDWSDAFKRHVDGYQNPPIHPNAEPVFERLTSLVADFAVHSHGSGRHDCVELDSPAEYWREVASRGVEPSEIDHCGDEIPDDLLDD